MPRYFTLPENTSKSVIHNTLDYDTQKDITKSLLYEKNPRTLQARHMGKTNLVVIVFEGTTAPYYVYYRGAEHRCILHEVVDVCDACGLLRRRTDVCPIRTEKHCKKCGVRDPPENQEPHRRWWQEEEESSSDSKILPGDQREGDTRTQDCAEDAGHEPRVPSGCFVNSLSGRRGTGVCQWPSFPLEVESQEWTLAASTEVQLGLGSR